MRILMVGAGATGGFYGGRMAQAGRDVTFLVRGERMRQLREHGLQIVSPQGDATIHPQLITADRLHEAAPFDIVIVSTKAYALDAAVADFGPAVGPDTVVLPILNGMSHIDTLQARFGPERVMAGSVRIVSDVDADGRVHQLTELDEFIFGELDGGVSDRARKLQHEFAVPGYTLTLTGDMRGALWQKWWLLATAGAICVIGDGSVGAVCSVPHGQETALAILQESMAVAKSNGHPAEPALAAGQRTRLTDPASSLTSSMYRDMQKGAPVEADHILGDLIARANGIPVPLLTAAYVRLKVYEAQRQSA